jgi:putative heme iron utilization protein
MTETITPKTAAENASETPVATSTIPARDPRQPADFDPIAVGRAMLRGTRVGSLGTLEPESGFPLVTLTSVATDLDGAPLILVSRLSNHTKNLLADPRVSLLLSQGGKGDPLAHPRLSVNARASVIEPGPDRDRARRRFLARHPKAKLYVDFTDFLFFRLEPGTVHLNGGFARAFDGDARLMMSRIDDPAGFEALEASAVEHMNEDHAEALALYATTLCRMPAGPWRATGLDPDGLDLAAGDLVARLAFPEPVTDGGTLRKMLKSLADAARAAGAAS